jgi:8-oxo-dGTP pyrophosphatase MutT (NUDIX family)
MPKEPLNIVCCLIFDGQNRLLLLKRHSEDLSGGLWATPGGKQELGEEASATAVREVKEETGLDLEATEYLGSHELRMPHGVARMKTYKSLINSSEEIVINREEHQAHQWFHVANLLDEENIIGGAHHTIRFWAY